MDGLRGYLIKSDKSCSHVDTVSALDSATAPETKLLWVDIYGELSGEVESALGRVLGWHPIVLENFHLASSRPKLINFDRYSQVTLHALNLDRPAEERLTIEIDVVIAKTYLITYHRHPVRSIEETLEDLSAGRLASVGADELLYHIISHGIDKYTPAIEEKKDLIASLEQEALYDPGQNLLERIVLLRDEVMELAVVMTPQQLILTQMATGVCRHVRPFIRPYFKDAESRLRNLIDELVTYKEMLANSLELYRSAMSSRTNDTMKVLTILSVMFMPLNFLTGLFGMNVGVPLSGHHHAFSFILILCGVSFAGMMIYFKAKSWF